MIYVGTCGYHFEDWKQNFYPRSITRQAWLNHYAKNFNALEINSTFYKMYEKDFFYSLIERTNEQLKLCVKVYRDITHTNINRENIHSNIMSAKKFYKTIKDISYEISFGVLLFQFPFSFKYNKENLKKLDSILSIFKKINSVVEFRHESWLNDDIFDFLEKKKIGFCNTDAPKIENLPNTNNISTSQNSYVRFHGRNKENWWEPDKPEDRYHYKYSNHELSRWVPAIKKLTKNSENVYIFMNNHKNANAVINGLYFMDKFKLKPAFENEQIEFDF